MHGSIGGSGLPAHLESARMKDRKSMVSLDAIAPGPLTLRSLPLPRHRQKAKRQASVRLVSSRIPRAFRFSETENQLFDISIGSATFPSDPRYFHRIRDISIRSGWSPDRDDPVKIESLTADLTLSKGRAGASGGSMSGAAIKITSAHKRKQASATLIDSHATFGTVSAQACHFDHPRTQQAA